MEKVFNPIISLSKTESKNIVKVMNWELKPSIGRSKLKKMLKQWQKLASKIQY